MNRCRRKGLHVRYRMSEISHRELTYLVKDEVLRENLFEN